MAPIWSRKGKEIMRRTNENHLMFVLVASALISQVSGCGNSTTFRGGAVGTTAETVKSNGDATASLPGGTGDADPNTVAGNGRTGNIDGDPSKVMQTRTLEREFAAGAVSTGNVEKTLARGEVSSNFTMASVYSDQTPSFTQNTLQPSVNKFTQGSAGTAVMQNFTQATTGSGPIDILVVIDNSGSMYEEQKNLATKLNPLLDSIEGADWQISVVTTDPKNGCQRALIRKGDAGGATTFANTITAAGLGGSGNERGILMSVVGLKGSFTVPGETPGSTTVVSDAGACPATASWLRPNAPVVVVIVSDEDNCSDNGSNCKTPTSFPWRTDDYLFNYLSTIRKPSEDARVYGLFWKPADITCNGGAYKGIQYESIVTRTKGFSGSICDGDYTTTLKLISKDAATILKNQFSLSSAPDAGSLKVYVNNVLTPAGWNVAGTTLTFTTVPVAGATIRTEYVVGAAPVLTELPLTAVPVVDSIEVMAGGVIVPKNPTTGWSYSAIGNKVVYRPADLAAVQVSYINATPALLSSFPLGTGVKAASLAVKVNGVVATNYTLNANTGVITFAVPPPQGAKVESTFQKLESKTLEYAFAIPTTVDAKSKKVVNLTTGNEIPVTWPAGKVLIAEANHVEGQVLKVSYLARNLGEEIRIPLAQEPIAGSVSVVAGASPCTAEGFSVVAGEVVVDCDPGASDKIVVSYTYVSMRTKDITISDVKVPENAVWQVSFDGVLARPGTDYSREGNSIKIIKDLPTTSKIKVAVNFIGE